LYYNQGGEIQEEYMDLEPIINQYQSNIQKLADKNNVSYDLMVENWSQKYEEFDSITDNYGIMDDIEEFDKDTAMPFVAVTINGSIIVASEPDEDGKRKVRYQSIKIRTDESSNVPEIFEAPLAENIAVNKTAIFEKTIETSFLIRIKTSENFSWEDFENKADALTQEFTRKFEMFDDEMMTRQLEVD
jgi:hypothetical protein